MALSVQRSAQTYTCTNSNIRIRRFGWQSSEWASKRCKRAKEWTKNRIQKRQYSSVYMAVWSSVMDWIVRCSTLVLLLTLCVRARPLSNIISFILNVWLLRTSTLCAALCAFIDANTLTSWTKRKFILPIQFKSWLSLASALAWLYCFLRLFPASNFSAQVWL